MKKFLVIAAMMVAAVSANAQNAVGQWTIQPKAGLGMAAMTNWSNTKMTVAAVLGGEFEYQYNPKVSFGGGLNFELAGTDLDDLGSVKDRSFTLGYITFPVVCNFYVYKNLALKAGLQPGFLIHANYHEENGNTTTDTKVTSNFNTFDLALPIGVSYQYNRWVFDARYLLGLTNVNKNNHYYNDSSRNSVFYITAGYKFNL